MASRKEQKERARQERLAREAAFEEATRRKRLFMLAGGGAAAIVIVAIVIVSTIASGGPSIAQRLSTRGSAPKLKLSSLASLGHLTAPPQPTSLSPEGIPVFQAQALAGTGSAARGETVDGIQCQGSEQSLFHIHAHLTIFVDGAARQVPYGIGIPNAQVQNTPQGAFVGGGSCLYWLHTHAADGIIHIESPVQRTFTLGDFFDIWGQPLGPARVGPASGAVTAIYDGKLYDGNPRDIPLQAHAQIQLDVGRPLVKPVSIHFVSGL
ncbi:hypothetical protein [Conexibacter sp. DBS9H8]|uniref:hypothetical protein n=1 Tax=Conexibacter sp. DBS9H8 TaxID=2937801 RepID=UPI00201077A0|nr:hypothetical protein [Conexibacter sp. DBS9H8]